MFAQRTSIVDNMQMIKIKEAVHSILRCIVCDFELSEKPITGESNREVNSMVPSVAKLKVEDKDKVNNGRRIKMVKDNIVKKKASRNKLS